MPPTDVVYRGKRSGHPDPSDPAERTLQQRPRKLFRPLPDSPELSATPSDELSTLLSDSLTAYESRRRSHRTALVSALEGRGEEEKKRLQQQYLRSFHRGLNRKRLAFREERLAGKRRAAEAAKEEASLLALKAAALAARSGDHPSSKAFDDLRGRVWTEIVKEHVLRTTKHVGQLTSSRQSHLKRLAVECQKAHRRASPALRASRDVGLRARRVAKEMLVFWKRNEKDEREARKRAEKEAAERRRIEEEEREAKRQAKKLEFLLTQTELFSHFVGKNMAKAGVDAQDDAETTEGSAIPTPTSAAATPADMDVDIDGDADTDADAHVDIDIDDSEGRALDFDEDDDHTIRAHAKQKASAALAAQVEKTRSFDLAAQEKRAVGAPPKTAEEALDEMDWQDPTTMGSAAEEVAQPRLLMAQLKPYQLKGLNWLVNLYDQGINGILADEMGLGKTVQSISLMAHLAEHHNIWGPFLVIAPASTLHNWQQEIARFVPAFKVLPYWGPAADRKILRKDWRKMYTDESPFNVLVTSYQLVVTDKEHFSRHRWQYMILDEAQAIKSSGSTRWKTLLGFDCRNRLLLTGTPVQNTMQELWSLLHFIMPTLFDSHDEFSDWFSKDIEGHVESKGSSALDAHQLRRLHMILRPFMLRRVKKHVQHELGDKVEIELRCSLTARQRRMYRQLRGRVNLQELMERAGPSGPTGAGGMDSLMNMLIQFRKVCNHPELFERADVISPFVLGLPGLSSLPTLVGRDSLTDPGYLIPGHPARSLLTQRLPSLWLHETGRAGSSVLPGWEAHTPSPLLREGGDLWREGEVSCLWHLLSSDPLPSETATVPLGPAWWRARQEIRREEAASLTRSPRLLSLLRLVGDQEVEGEAGRLDMSAPTTRLGHLLATEIDVRVWSTLLPCYAPRALAPPALLEVGSLAAMASLHRAGEQPSTLLPPLPPAPALRLHPPLFPAPTLPPRCTLARGYSPLWVPPVGQLVQESGKMALLDRLLPELKAGGHRVLLYFQMTRMIDLMEEYLGYRKYSYLRLDGSSKISDRRDMVTDWQTRPDLFIFLLSTRAGGLGINLTAADTVIFYDSDWNPTVDQQAMDRAHRLGQTRQVTVYRLITVGTIEERILQRAKQKDDMQKMVMTGGDYRPGASADLKGKELVSLLMDEGDGV